MADRRRDGEHQEPTLELPKLFGRRRRAAEAHTSAEEPTPVDEPTPGPAGPAESVPPPSAIAADGPTPAARVDEGGARKAERAGPPLPARLAAALTGLLVGATGTLLTYGSLRGCEALTGTGSCGGGAGLLLLVAISAVMVLLGGALLKAWSVTDPRSTSLLAVGLTAVVVMLTMLEAVSSAWTFLAVPLVCMTAYAAAHWLTSAFAEVDRPGADVR